MSSALAAVPALAAGPALDDAPVELAAGIVGMSAPLAELPPVRLSASGMTTSLRVAKGRLVKRELAGSASTAAPVVGLSLPLGMPPLGLATPAG